jgi:uncharacterized protein YecE (DUF72 family)
LSDYLIGTGGWAYFKIPNKVSLKAYSEIFNFVEVNYTFYQYPTTETVYKWRRTVPKQFTFSVRCNQELTHKIGLRPVNESYQTLYQMRTYCEILHSPYLVLETPAAYVMNQDNIDDAKEFFSTINLKGINLVWELRAPINQAVTSLMQDFNIIHCVDLSKERPSYNSDITYSRLFGKGQHNLYQFTDNELVEIDQKTKDTNSKTVILSYHGMRMNTDAQRFLQYKKTGNFMPVTSYVGLDSAKAVLAEDTKFPSSKAELEQKQGWKVIDLTLDRRIHLSELLNKIPNKTYANLDEVINELGGVL